ncbi:hypothetical protein GCM10010251_78000 [Streptomyces aurantiogriseus]|uniref:Uncharacterized protein n=1 Tax=Streptomyces aurantiogriseus TaxID=66870 RepID=A0A918FKZ7_9ACTN|nr:hypothetical protein GCM10010251_78000 [Streptomyces aurantiogriseus]
MGWGEGRGGGKPPKQWSYHQAGSSRPSMALSFSRAQVSQQY